MAPSIFITGVTGYIGGSIFATLVKDHPDYELTVLMRNIPKDFEKSHPTVQIVKGDFDSSEAIISAASKADIVINAGSSDHLPLINSLITGLLLSAPTPSSPRHLIHLSGTGLIADWLSPSHLGQLNPRIWSDVSDLPSILSLPSSALHRPIDARVQQAAREHGDVIKTAIVCPPDIYGKGSGPGKRVSIYVPLFLEEIRRHGGLPFYAGTGENERGWVHVDDLMGVFGGLVEDAVRGGEGADWGLEGYYFAATQMHSQRAIATQVAEILHKHKLIESSEPRALPLETVAGMADIFGRPNVGLYLFAANARSVPDRATTVFGWKAKEPLLWDFLEEEVLELWNKK